MTSQLPTYLDNSSSVVRLRIFCLNLLSCLLNVHPFYCVNYLGSLFYVEGKILMVTITFLSYFCEILWCKHFVYCSRMSHGVLGSTLKCQNIF